MEKRNQRHTRGKKVNRKPAERSAADSAIAMKRIDKELKHARVEQKEIATELQRHKSHIEQQNEVLRSAERDLDKKRNEYYVLFDLAPIGYFTFDNRGVILDVNLVGALLLGIDKHRLTNKFFAYYVAPGERSKFYIYLYKVFKTRKKESMELNLKKPTGEQLIVSLDSVIIKDLYGIGNRCLTAVTDVSEQKMTEEILKRDKETVEQQVEQRSAELLKTRQELEEAQRLSGIGLLAASIAHELRNPLTVIRLATYSMKKSIKKNNGKNQFDKHLANIDKKINESDRIINNLLYYSRIRLPEFKRTVLYDMLKDSVEYMQRKYQGWNVIVHKRYRGLKRVTIDVDAMQLGELLNNLLDNAYESLPDKTGTIEIEGKYDVSQKTIHIRISDTGAGIDPEDLPKIFDPFFTTKSKGTGLGLAVCHQIAILHDGTLNVESIPGKGSSFELILPKNKTRPTLMNKINQ
jgi:PAS domain S-box-containing protein